MQSYEKEGTATCVPNNSASSVDNTSVEQLNARPPKKPMSDAHRRGRLTTISLRSRTQFEQSFNDLIAPLFQYWNGVFVFRFPADGPGDSSVAAWFLDGDLMYCPAENGKKPSPLNSYLDGAQPVAKFRLNSGLSLQYEVNIEGEDPLGEVLIVNGLLKHLCHLMKSNDAAGSLDCPLNTTVDARYYKFQAAVQTIFAPTAFTYLKKIVDGHIQRKAE